MMLAETRLTPWCRPVRGVAMSLPSRMRHGAQLTLVDSEGRVGVGDIAPLVGFSDETLEQAVAEVTRWSADLVNGPWCPELDAIASLTSRLRSPSARFAADSALLQLLATKRQCRVSQLLHPREVGPVVRQAVIGEAVEAAEAVAEGYTVLKVKVARHSLNSELLLLMALRSAYPRVTLRVDANAGWDIETAMAALPTLAQLGIELLEQPLLPSDLEGAAALRGHGVAIGADEAARTLQEIDAIARAQAADAVVLKPTLTGGIFETLAMARRARFHGLRVILSHTLESHAGHAALVEVANALSGDDLWGAGIDTDRCFDGDDKMAEAVAA